MALINCPECGKQVSNKAEKCPHCGTTIVEKSGCLIKIIAGLLVLGAIGSWSHYLNPPKPKTPEQIEQESINKHFLYDGSHIGLTLLIRKTLNDPDSYEHIRSTHTRNNDTFTVTTTFRAKNEMGGMSTHEIIGIVDLNGNVIRITSHKQLNRL